MIYWKAHNSLKLGRTVWLFDQLVDRFIMPLSLFNHVSIVCYHIYSHVSSTVWYFVRHVGMKVEVLISLVLSFFFFIPGIVYSLFILWTTPAACHGLPKWLIPHIWTNHCCRADTHACEVVINKPHWWVLEISIRWYDPCFVMLRAGQLRWQWHCIAQVCWRIRLQGCETCAHGIV